MLVVAQLLHCLLELCSKTYTLGQERAGYEDLRNYLKSNEILGV
jgi:hypothetical protein